MAFPPRADDINFLVNDVPDLTKEERNTLISVMQKAQELDAQERNKMNKPLEGQLYKYTNVVKGWQYRWFILIPETGILEYYMLDEVKKKRPRGAVYLAGAVISPSDEDSQSFAISAACGELYKLKANDAKERQFWVNRIRAVAERHTDTIAEKNPPLPPREILPPLISRTQSIPVEQSVWYTNEIYDTAQTILSNTKTLFTHNTPTNSRVSQRASSVTEALSAVRDMLLGTEARLNNLTRSIELLPCSGLGPKCCDTDMLLLKATSAATVKSLQQCYTILQHQQVAINFPKAMVNNRRAKSSSTASNDLNESTASDSSKDTSFTADPSGEVTDLEEESETDFQLDATQHSTILNMMSQPKLGADLTKVSMPSFVLEPRSLLEMFADFMRHPEFFVRISSLSTPEERMVAVLEWYLTSFNAAREASVTKKPYNPILGEMFRCSWKVPMKEGNRDNKFEDSAKVTFVAEQVSHHPPVSAFYVECPKKNMAMSAHICIKSNFLTSFVGVSFVGEVKLQLLNFGETYEFSLPSAHLRNILQVPWIELGGRVNVSCSSSNYSAFVTFQTKPHVTAVPHQIVGELKQGEDLIYRISGEWNSIIHFTSPDNSRITKSVDVTSLNRSRKHIRPLDQQDALESRKLWFNVSKALHEGNFALAQEEKLKLEEEQREEERKRAATDTDYHGKLFQKVDDVWEYKYPLPFCNS